ncbi:MAG: PadR family transcriptional regulator [Asgard group archaeon]|nr:PadR family transcriptional regulator [Asgard group archaeon]
MDIEEEVNRLESEYKKGFAKPLILMMLAEKENYSYALAKKIIEKTSGKISIVVPNIYPILKSLKKSGYIQEMKSKDHSSRIFYEVTELGYALLDELTESLQQFLKIFNNLIDDYNEIKVEKKI